MVKTQTVSQLARAERMRIAAEDGAQARAEVQARDVAVRKNMERLRALRLAREAEGGYVEILELPSLKVRFRLGRHAGSVTGLAWRPDSAQLAVADLDGVKLWNLRDGQLEQRLDRTRADMPDRRAGNRAPRDEVADVVAKGRMHPLHRSHRIASPHLTFSAGTPHVRRTDWPSPIRSFGRPRGTSCLPA